MPDKVLNVLFLCTHNSARSILAEAVLNHIGGGSFKGFSAGSSPGPHQQPHPMGLAALRAAGIGTDGLRSKSGDAFAGEACPFWPGQPATAHWGYPDPSAVGGDEAQQREAFRLTLLALHRRLELLVNLPPEAIGRLGLEGSARRLADA